MTFSSISRAVERIVASSWAFGAACTAILLWAAIGPLFGWSDTWQLVINTATTIVTFLMVFLIQNTQSRDTQAIHIKLDELIRATREARNEVISAEEMDERQLTEARGELRDLADL